MIKRKSVRVAGYADLPFIYDIELKSYEYPLNHEQLRELFETPRVIPIIAKVGQRCVSWGYGVAHEDGDLEIVRVATLPEFRLEGFATAVLAEIWKHAVKTYGCNSNIFIMIPEYQTLPDDPDCVVPFLNAMRFKAVGTETDYFHRYGRPYDGIKFSRRV